MVIKVPLFEAAATYLFILNYKNNKQEPELAAVILVTIMLKPLYTRALQYYKNMYE